MQIRVANRQDEPLIRTIVFQQLEESGIQSELDGLDSDLRNIEHNYFWYDGLCIVAENEGQIIGVLAARRQEGHDENLELTRLVVTPGARRRGAGKSLMKTALFFAKNMEYEKLVLNQNRRGSGSAADQLLLTKLGFTKNDAAAWERRLPAGTDKKCP